MAIALAGTVFPAKAQTSFKSDGTWHTMSLAFGATRMLPTDANSPDHVMRQLYVLSDDHFMSIQCVERLETSYQNAFDNEGSYDRLFPRHISYSLSIRWDEPQPADWNRQINFEIFGTVSEWSSLSESYGGVHSVALEPRHLTDMLNNNDADIRATLGDADWSYIFPLENLSTAFSSIECLTRE